MKSLYKLILIIFIWSTNISNSLSTTHTINVGPSSFSPAFVSANIGDTIMWMFYYGSHTTTSTSVPAGAQPWDAQINSSSPTFLYIITLGGTYDYECTFHGFTGEINVGGLITGLSPNIAFKGQQLNTLLSGSLLYNSSGLAVCNPSDVLLVHTLNNDTIVASSVSIQGDSIYIGWNISSTASIGLYNLYVNLWSYDTIMGCWSLLAPYSLLANAFGIDQGLINGTAFFDVNQDSFYSQGVDIGIHSQKILILPDSILIYTDSSGNYTAIVDSGFHTLRIQSGSGFVPLGSDSAVVNVATGNIVNQNFNLDTTFVNYSVDFYIIGRPRCNSQQNYIITYDSKSILPLNLKLKLYHSSSVIYNSSGIPIDSINGDTLYFTLNNIPYGQGTFTLNFSIPGPGTINFNTSVEVYDIQNVLHGAYEKFTTQTVLCSFDPNDKSVSPEGEQVQHFTLFGDELLYTIRFQNTGNDTAYDIRILDTLDADLDWNSFRIISSSDPVIPELDVNGIVNFQFYNIMLPDSNIDEPGSHGYVSYAIKCKSGLPENTSVTNLANIYFDMNPPIVTNETDNTMVSVIPVGITEYGADHAIKVFPNPFNETIRIEVEIVSGKIIITDIQGRIVFSSMIQDNFTADLSFLMPGVYLYNVVNEKNERFYGRLIKQ